MSVSQSLDGKPVSRRRKLQLRQLNSLSLDPHDGDDNNIVIPITKVMVFHSSESSRTFSYLTGNALYPVATTEVCKIFPFDLAFSMPVHKAQGRTIPRVVLDLTCHPSYFSQIEFAAIFVAMSRVKERGHIRLLTHKLPGTDRFNPRETYAYITQLHPSNYVLAFYEGYTRPHGTPSIPDQEGMTWNPSKEALEYSSAEN